MSDTWLTQALATSHPLQSSPLEFALMSKLLDVIENQGYSKQDYHIALAAAFDLLVAAEYYCAVEHTGWLSCSFPEPLLLYNYTNTCPRCLLNGKFVFHKAKKPRSGSIGAITSRLLGLFIKELLHRRGLPIEVCKGSEPVDTLFVDKTTTPTTVFFVEIKASPLLTLPLALPLPRKSTHATSQPNNHCDFDFDDSLLFGSKIHIYVPQQDNEQSGVTQYKGHLFPLGSKQGKTDQAWAYQGMVDLLENKTFVDNYFCFWHTAFASYQHRYQHPFFWFTNGCGQPNPRPDTWPRRAGTGYESVSDGKTSVGMDRTDDIKKATYQVLKLGTEGKPSSQYCYKTGIISNIHAVRHHDNYLAALTNIIWARESTGFVRKGNRSGGHE